MKVYKYQKTCETCQRIFQTNKHKQRYCNKKCRHSKYYTYKTETYTESQCQLCQKTYSKSDRNVNQKYYSDECRELKQKIPPLSKWVILHRDKFTCQYCKTQELPLHIDHIVPRDKDGSDYASNLIAACVRCNLEKSAKEIEPSQLKSILKKVSERNEAYNIPEMQLYEPNKADPPEVHRRMPPKLRMLYAEFADRF